MRTLDYFFREKKNKVLKVALFGYLTLFLLLCGNASKSQRSCVNSQQTNNIWIKEIDRGGERNKHQLNITMRFDEPVIDR